MIVTILCVLAFVVLSVLLEKYIREEGEGYLRITYLLLVFLLIPLAIISYVKTTEELGYQKIQYERQQLIEEYESGNQFSYDDIIAFDKDLRDYKFWGKNPFVNWFYNQRIVDDVDYILYDIE